MVSRFASRSDQEGTTPAVRCCVASSSSPRSLARARPFPRGRLSGGCRSVGRRAETMGVRGPAAAGELRGHPRGVWAIAVCMRNLRVGAVASPSRLGRQRGPSRCEGPAPGLAPSGGLSLAISSLTEPCSRPVPAAVPREQRRFPAHHSCAEHQRGREEEGGVRSDGHQGCGPSLRGPGARLGAQPARTEGFRAPPAGPSSEPGSASTVVCARSVRAVGADPPGPVATAGPLVSLRCAGRLRST